MMEAIYSFLAFLGVSLIWILKNKADEARNYREKYETAQLSADKLKVEHDLQKLKFQELIDRSNARIADESKPGSDT